VVTNVYSAHMDPDDWKQPKQFDPERFLDDSGNVVGRERILAFGLGVLFGGRSAVVRKCKSDSDNEKLCKYVCINNNQLDTKSNPNS